MALTGTVDPDRWWWPFTYSGVQVRHTDCGGFMYYQCEDVTLTITATTCDRCDPGFQQHQLNLFDYNGGTDGNNA